MDSYESSGRLRYGRNTYWLVLDCDLGICEYYSHLYNLHSHKTSKLQLPAHGAHITIVAGKYESAPSHPKWNAYQGEIVKFAYTPTVYNAGVYFWLRVNCPRLSDIRQELGLSPQPYTPFHLTIGNLKHDTSLQTVAN